MKMFACVFVYAYFYIYVYVFIHIFLYIYRFMYWQYINHVKITHKEHIIYVNKTVDRHGIQIASVNCIYLSSFYCKFADIHQTRCITQFFQKITLMNFPE